MPELNMDSPTKDLLWRFKYDLGNDLVNSDGSVFKDGLEMYINDVGEVDEWGDTEELEVWGHANREEVEILHAFLGKYLAETVNSEHTES